MIAKYDKVQIINLAAETMMIALSSQILGIFFQVYKYALNAIQKEKWTLYFTSGTSIISLLIIYIISHRMNFGLAGVFAGLGIHNAILSIEFFIKYSCSAKHMQELICR